MLSGPLYKRVSQIFSVGGGCSQACRLRVLYIFLNFPVLFIQPVWSLRYFRGVAVGLQFKVAVNVVAASLVRRNR